MENRSGIVVEAELTEATGTTERETTITLLKRTSSRTCSPAWSAGRAPACRRPSARRSTHRARNAGHAASALDLQTWKLARAAGPVVVIGTVGEDTRHRRNPPVQPSVSWTTSGRLGLARRLAGDSMALTPRGRLRWSRGGRGWGGRLRSWLAPQQPLEVSWRASQTARPGGTLALPAWPNRVPTGLPNPARDRPVAPPGEFKMPACAPLHHPFRGPEYARRPIATLEPAHPTVRLGRPRFTIAGRRAGAGWCR